MYSLKTIKGYKPNMDLRQTQKAIKLLKDTFEVKLAMSLNLERVSAPIIVASGSGINDDLSGVERAVKFDVARIKDYDAEIVQSLAKWKRVALHEYNFGTGEGIYTDMNALRRDDDIDNVHSIYVDQWDWEAIIVKENRNLEFLKSTVLKIVGSIIDTQEAVKKEFECISTSLERNVFFITSQELLDLYPNLTPTEREQKIVKDKKTVFVSNIGDRLSNGQKHSQRAPDYDDWSLNGDLLFYNELLDDVLEVSSMGIRVDSSSMQTQLQKANATNRSKYKYHQDIINNVLPLTIGGGIGQSRLCMLLLQKLHIGEVHASIWPKQMIDECRVAGIQLL